MAPKPFKPWLEMTEAELAATQEALEARLQLEIDIANQAQRRPSFRRDLFWLCQRYLRYDTVVGLAAGRLLAVHPLPGTTVQWHADLQLLLDTVLSVNGWGYCASSRRAQEAASRIQHILKKEESA